MGTNYQFGLSPESRYSKEPVQMYPFTFQLAKSEIAFGLPSFGSGERQILLLNPITIHKYLMIMAQMVYMMDHKPITLQGGIWKSLWLQPTC